MAWRQCDPFTEETKKYKINANVSHYRYLLLQQSTTSSEESLVGSPPL